MTVVLIVVLCLAIGGIGVVLGVVLGGYLRGGNDAVAVDQVVLAALAQFQANSAGERQAAIRAAAEHAAMASGQALSAQRDVIDSRLDHVRVEVRDELNRVSELVRQLGSSSARQFGAVSEALANQAEVTAALGASTQSLREALSSPKARGQWGERMAEDILRLAGFVENVNYVKQTAIEGGRGLPDFTFPLPALPGISIAEGDAVREGEVHTNVTVDLQ